MKTSRIFGFLSALGILFCSVSCASKKPEPPRSKISSIPFNKPASWEGSGGLPGMPTGR
ncbi:MAG: hypothetical protein ACKVJU_18325 [Verrucomicrobiales bacterium]